MTAPTLSIIIATGGRASVLDTIASLQPQLEHGDEIIISRLDCDWGHAARNLAMPRAAGNYLMFIDDDDWHELSALKVVRSALEDQPDRVHLFAMRYQDTGMLVLPRWPLQMGYVSTQMMVVPNVKGCLGEWGDRYEGDFDFITSTMDLRRDGVVLHMQAIAQIGVPEHRRAVASIYR